MSWFTLAQKSESEFSKFDKKQIVISFDYDGTTVFTDPDKPYDASADNPINPYAAKLMNLYAKQGCKIIIVTCRTPHEIKAIWKTIDDNNLPVSEVYATSHQSKLPTLENAGACAHYDNDPIRLKEIEENDSIQTYRETDMEIHVKNWSKT